MIDLTQDIKPASKLVLTDEMTAILNHSPTTDLVVEAGAGSGKTTLLTEYAKKWRQRGLYLSYNAAIAKEAQTRFPKNIDAMTAHSYAYRTLNVSRYKSRLVAKIRRNHIREAGFKLDNPHLSEDRMIKAILAGIQNFTNSAGTILKESHCELEFAPKQTRDKVMPVIAEVILKFIQFEVGSLPFTHDCYLKYLEMSGSMGSEYDYILVDEAQDLNPILLSLIQKSGRPVIMVGDRKQCLPSGAPVLTPTGYVSIENIKKNDMVMSADGSGGIIPAIVTDVFSKQIACELVTIITKTGKTIETTPDHVHFAGFRKNTGLPSWNVYLMYREDYGFRVGTSCTYEGGGHKHNGWTARLRQEKADSVFVIESGLSRENASVREKVISLNYGIPTVVFKNRNQTAFGDAYIEKIYRQVDSRSGALRLLKDLGLDPNRPHHRPKCNQKNRFNFNITMCGDRGMHRYSISGDKPDHAKILEKIGIRTRSNHKGGWRVENSSTDLGKIYDIYDRIKASLPVNLIETASFCNGNSLPLTNASNCVRGMEIFVKNDEGAVLKDEIVEVKRNAYEGTVYDINVEKYHNFISNNIVTHNSIYAFRGSVDAMGQVDAPRLPLSQSWRFGKPIDAIANYILSYTTVPPTWKIKGRPGHDTEVKIYAGKAARESLILARTNIRLFEGLVTTQVPFHVIGGFEAIAVQLTSALSLSKGDRTKIFDSLVMSYRNWEEMVSDAEEDDDREVKRIVKIVQDYGDDIIPLIERLNKLHRTHRGDASIILSTAHKAKGLEAENVILLDDFPTPSELEARRIEHNISLTEYDQEFHLLYVSVTRVLKTLQLPEKLYDAFEKPILEKAP